MKKLDKLRYPIGNFEYGKSYSLPQTRQHIKTIARFPKDLKKLIKKLNREALDTTYRSGGWTVRQVVHHLADSHMNAYVRMKLAVTEPAPIIKPYEENLWAETSDAKQGSVKTSLQLLNALHKRWVAFLERLSDEDLERGYFHPERQSLVLLPEAIALYAWHCKHHLAHISLVVQGKLTADKEQPNDLKPAKKPKNKTADTARLTRSEILEKARAARMANLVEQPDAPTKAVKAPKKAAAASDGPKMTRAEILAKARAARSANKATAPAAPEKAAKAPKKAAAASDGPKMTRAEILAKARAARSANKASAPAAPEKAAKAPKKAAAASDGPKMTRAEILAKARAARSANKASAPAAPEKAAKAPKKAAAPAKVAKAPKKAAEVADGPKLTRAEILAKARAARGKKTT